YGDDHGLDVLAGEQVGHIAGAVGPVLLSELPGQSLVLVDHRRQVRRSGGGQEALDVQVADDAQADDADAGALAHRVASRRWMGSSARRRGSGGLGVAAGPVVVESVMGSFIRLLPDMWVLACYASGCASTGQSLIQSQKGMA